MLGTAGRNRGGDLMAIASTDNVVRRLTADGDLDIAFVDLTGAASNTGSNAPLVAPDNFDITTSVTNILAQVAPERVILGLPWYGRAWSTVSREPHAETRSGAIAAK